MSLQGGWRDAEVADDLPDLAVHERTAELERNPPPSHRKRSRARLRELTDRIDGPRIASMRLEPVPAAYRMLARQLGLDPDADGMPGDELMRQRLLRGEFPSYGVVEDALNIALLETGVPVFALGAELVDGPLGVRPVREGEVLASGDPAEPGALAIADAVRPLALVLRDPGVPRPGRLVVYALRATGVPSIVVDEALWLAVEVMQG